MKNQPSLSVNRFSSPLRTQPVSPASDAEPLFHAGDTVMHPSEGICTVAGLREMAFNGSMRKYYVLVPSSEKSSSTVYLPIDRGNTLLRRLLSEADIRILIRSSRDYAGLWIDDSKQRKEAFTRILSEGNYARIIRMIHEIHLEGEQRTKEGKRPCASDEAVRMEAERLLHQEFSYVLHMSLEDTVAFIIGELNRA
ncbi:MAG: hypothetical protein IJD60_02810 [Clostridia bacterium]|nr:hypothetical protein [Clostridia bacterium]